MCSRRFCTLFAISVICCSLSITCFATSSSGDMSSEDVPVDVLPPAADLAEEVEEVEEVEEPPTPAAPVFDAENPLPVVIVDEEPSFYVAAAPSDDVAVLDIGSTPPDSPLFYGAGYITGVDSSLGECTIYLPISYRNGYLGTDSNGYLFNVSSSSISCYMEGVYNNSVTIPAFSYPRYRRTSGSSYEYMHLTPENANVNIATADAPKVPASDMLPYVSIFFLGVIVLCFLTRSRH